jgi:hypothetical protein
MRSDARYVLVLVDATQQQFAAIVGACNWRFAGKWRLLTYTKKQKSDKKSYFAQNLEDWSLTLSGSPLRGFYCHSYAPKSPFD